ncbi:hypothetical protein Tco_0689475 [Tanacetum coccineum]
MLSQILGPKTSSQSYPSSNKPKFQSNSSQQHNQNKNTKSDYKGKYKALKSELAVLTKKINAMSKNKNEKGLVDESFDWDEESLSFEDECVTRVKVWLSLKMGQLGKKKETISSKEVVFTKVDEYPSETVPEITSDSESECDNQEPLPPLHKLSRAV